MRFTKLVPNIFYEDIKEGIALFVDCLEFSIGFNDLDSESPMLCGSEGHLVCISFSE